MSLNSEEMIGQEFIVNKELEALMPDMAPKKFALFKANIKSVGLNHPIEVLPDKTIVDGHHRYKACIELGIPVYKIPFVVLKLNGVQEALEYAENVNGNRRHLNPYQKATSALKAYGYRYTDKEIADKIGMNNSDLGKIRRLNEKLGNSQVPAKASKYLSELNSGDIGYTVVLKELECAENIDNIIGCIDAKDKVYYKTAKDKVNKSRMTPEQVKLFKREMQEKYIDLKYDKKALKQLNTDIAKLETPELFEKVEKGYHSFVQPIVKKIYEAEDKFSDNVVIWNVTSEEGYEDCIAYLNSLKGTGRLMGMFGFMNLPKDMIREDSHVR